MEDRENQRIAAAIRWMAERHAEQPPLERIAAVACMSPAHFSRSFHRWAGISPKQFLQHLTLNDLKQRLARGEDLLSAGNAAGLSSLGRVHDHFVTLDAVTPGEYRRAGEGLRIGWGVHASPFGELLVATTARGVCFLAFVHEQDVQAALAAVAREWPGAELVEQQESSGEVALKLFAGEPVRLHVRGTNFQVQVWRALLRIPEGVLASYSGIARGIGRPHSVRAVASAVGANPVSWLIPCHRVIRQSGALGGYRWGLRCKQALLAFEAARAKL